MSLDVFFRKRIFEPLGMNDTYFYLPATKHNRLVNLYVEKDKKLEKPGAIDFNGKINTDYPKMQNTYYSGGGGLSALLGRTVYEVFLEEHADGYFRLEKEIFIHGRPVYVLQSFLRPDGRIGWVDNRKYPIPNAGGEVVGLFGIARDVTDRVDAEAALRTEQVRLQLVLDHAPIGIWMQNGLGKLSVVNKAFCDATGIPESTFLSVPHYGELIPDAFREQCLTSDAKALASSGISVTHQRLPFVDGRIHDLRVVKAVSRDDEGTPQALIGLSIAISDELHQPEALRLERDNSRNILETIDALIVAVESCQRSSGGGPTAVVVLLDARSISGRRS